jgi:hypothetical protein
MSVLWDDPTAPLWDSSQPFWDVGEDQNRRRSMKQNLITLALSDADWTAVDGALTTLEEKLAGLVDLTPQQRHDLGKMGDKSEAFCRQTVTVLTQNEDRVPPSFDLPELQGDLANLDKLRIRSTRVRQLMERIDDSEIALGSDVMSGSLEGYAMLKVSGLGAGLDQLRQQMSARFNRKSKPQDGQPPAPAP